MSKYRVVYVPPRRRADGKRHWSYRSANLMADIYHDSHGHYRIIAYVWKQNAWQIVDKATATNKRNAQRIAREFVVHGGDD